MLSNIDTVSPSVWSRVAISRLIAEQMKFRLFCGLIELQMVVRRKPRHCWLRGFDLSLPLEFFERHEWEIKLLAHVRGKRFVEGVQIRFFAGGETRSFFLT